MIDAIVRHTTAFIAQLSTSAGLRAPLAHLADQVFLDLSRAIESQGVSRKVVASMFGMALRGYQRKVHRLSDSTRQENRTLWEAEVEHLHEHGPTQRSGDEGCPGGLSCVSDLQCGGTVDSSSCQALCEQDADCAELSQAARCQAGVCTREGEGFSRSAVSRPLSSAVAAGKGSDDSSGEVVILACLGPATPPVRRFTCVTPLVNGWVSMAA